MSNLSKETIDRIKADAQHYANVEIGGKDKISVPSLLNQWEQTCYDFEAGALHEADRAQPIIDALQELVNLKCIKERFGKTDEYLNNQPLAWEAATSALAKYKEVSNV